MMQEITTHRLDGRERAAAAPFLFRSQQMQLQREGVVIGAYCGGTLCGAAGAVSDDAVLVIESLFVAKPYRGRGAASAMLAALARIARKAGLQALSVSYSCTLEQAPALHRLFLRNGFTMPEEGETLLRVPLSSLQNSRFAAIPSRLPEGAAHIVPISRLPAHAEEWYHRLTAADELPFLSMQHAPGRVLPALCLAYLDGTAVRALLVVSDVDGCLHICGAYIEQIQYGRALIALLQAALAIAQEQYPEYDTLTVTEATAPGAGLIERLLEGAEVTRYTAYLAGRLLVPAVVHPLAGFGGMLARLNTMTEALAQREIGSRLVLEEGALPYLELEVSPDGPVAELRYTVQDADSYEGLQLHATTAFPAAAWQGAQLDTLCGRMAAAGEAQAYVSDQSPQDILLYASLEEKQAFDSEKVIDGFIRPYLAQAAQCAALMADGIGG